MLNVGSFASYPRMSSKKSIIDYYYFYQDYNNSRLEPE